MNGAQPFRSRSRAASRRMTRRCVLWINSRPQSVARRPARGDGASCSKARRAPDARSLRKDATAPHPTPRRAIASGEERQGLPLPGEERSTVRRRCACEGLGAFRRGRAHPFPRSCDRPHSAGERWRAAPDPYALAAPSGENNDGRGSGRRAARWLTAASLQALMGLTPASLGGAREEDALAA